MERRQQLTVFLEKRRCDHAPTLRIISQDGHLFASWYVSGALHVAALLTTLESIFPGIGRGHDQMELKCREIECPHCWESIPDHMRHNWS